MTQEHGEQIQAEAELSEEQLDQVAGGGKDKWPDPPQGVGFTSDPLTVAM